MRSERTPRSNNEQLELVITRQIVHRTWSRIHRLEVEVIDGRVVVRGRTSSYHVKQLALEGVLDVIGSTNATPVQLDIEVGNEVLRPTHRPRIPH